MIIGLHTPSRKVFIARVMLCDFHDGFNQGASVVRKSMSA